MPKHTATSDISTASRSARYARYRLGHWAEWLAAFALTVRGYRLLDRRYKSQCGELDLVFVRGCVIAFVEVKARADLDLAFAAMTDGQARRMRDAAELWIARRPKFQAFDMRFDCVFVLPWRWPIHIVAGA
jgi:putative endonuclease